MKETFYGSFYQLASPPFHITPDPAVFFATQTHQQALGAVEYGVAAGKGFIVITGEVGVGKTTVLRSVLDRLVPEKTKIIYLFNPNLTVANLYAAIVEGLDAPPPTASDPAEIVQQLQHALLETNQRGIDVILAVDEAQNMPEATLESLRVLSNLETAKSKLLQIILVGQPELEATLKKHGLRQLAQRVAVRAKILPLTFRQSCRYVQHRLIAAGRPTEPPLFTVPALSYLALISRGIPRTLNICADNALINGYGHRAQRISLKIVREAVRPLQIRPLLRRRPAMAALAACVLILAGLDLALAPPRTRRAGAGALPVRRGAGRVDGPHPGRAWAQGGSDTGACAECPRGSAARRCRPAPGAECDGGRDAGCGHPRGRGSTPRRGAGSSVRDRPSGSPKLGQQPDRPAAAAAAADRDSGGGGSAGATKPTGQALAGTARRYPHPRLQRNIWQLQFGPIKGTFCL